MHTDVSGKSLFQLVFLFWVVMDSLGTLPIFVSLLKHFEPSKQYRIITRELLFALALMILFLFFGQTFLGLLNISHAALEIAGGTILFLIAIKMIFSKPSFEKKEKNLSRDPLIVPLAVPSIAGPAILATIALYGGGIQNKATVLLAVVIAWALSLIVLLLSPFLNTRLGENGVVAIERLFGYIVVLISTQMAFTGLVSALK
jgi:multiple antibiotic resistance protein